MMTDDDNADSVAEGMGFELLASSLRADLSDEGAFLEALATKLGGALPHRVTIQRGGGLFSHTHPIQRMSVNLGDWEYDIHAEHGGTLAAARTHAVRGIALKSEPMSVDEWIETLGEELALLARHSAQDRAALQRLLG
jgi:hypothetical protein